MKEKRATGIKRKLAFVMLVSLVSLLIITSGCVAAGAQTGEPYTYSSDIYDASKASPATEQEVLDFLAQDATDKNSCEKRSMSVDISPLMSGGMPICKGWKPAWSG
jgi:hypothetical protein